MPEGSIVDLADSLAPSQMDGTFGVHPNCQGHQALWQAVIKQAFRPAEIRTDRLRAALKGVGGQAGAANISSAAAARDSQLRSDLASL